jgi:hypothetical protein
LGPNGKTLAICDLTSLLPPTEFAKTVNSEDAYGLVWEDHALIFLRKHQRQFILVTQQGTIQAFDLAAGKRLHLSPEQRQQIREEAILLARKNLVDAPQLGAIQVGFLHDTASIPTLKRLLDDKTVTGWTNIKLSSTKTPQYDELYGVQLAAGQGLLTLLKEGAVDLITSRMQGANPGMRDEWRMLLKSVRSHTDVSQ